MDGTAPGLPQREMALTLDGLKGSEILHTEQRLGQLPDEQLQQAGRIVLFDAFPIESPFIKLRFQFLAKILKGRRRGKKKKKLQVHFFFFPAESVIHFPLSKRVYSLEKNLKVLKATLLCHSEKYYLATGTPPVTNYSQGHRLQKLVYIFS